MLSDDSSSDSETGRFKGQTKTEEDKGSSRKEDTFKSSGRNRPSENDRFRRDGNRRRVDRDSYKHSRDKQGYSRHSPVRRRHSRNRSPRRSRDRNRRRNSRDKSKARDCRHSPSKDRRNRSRSKSLKERDVRSRSHKSAEKSRSHRTADNKRDLKDEIRKTIEPKSSETKYDRRSREKTSTSPELGKKQSEVYKPPPSKRRAESPKKAESPIAVEHDSDHAAEVQPGSYYSMIPAIIKDKSEESSEIDSSDDERLRAKLLNLEKELQKTKKKKHHKKKHKTKSSKTRREKDDANTSVEVTSTTDIQDVVDVSENQADAVPEVSSTQKGPKESSEEGEISSEDDNQEVNYDPSDLRHKLRSRTKTASKPDVCGPALPPHLESRFRRSTSVEIEGPMLPPHLQPPKHIGPSIPSEMRKVLAERDCEIIEEQSSDEDAGIGPLPVGAEDKWSEAHQLLEERALDIKIKKLDGRSLDSQKIKSREQWMLELPEGKAKIMGLEARSFRAKEGPDMSDRSSWTDTPEEKAKKAAGIVKEEDADQVMRREARAKQIANRDEEQEIAIKKHKKKHKREESLLEMHQKKLKKKKKKEEKDEGKQERRPFSRDVDLQVNRFDEAQKKSIIKKAQGLNTRFSQGEAKYLIAKTPSSRNDTHWFA